MCAFVWKRVRPQITPRASERQRGAKRPEKAGTITQPSLSGTLAASASTSAAALDQPEVVAQPLHERSGDRDRALEHVGRRLVAELVGDAGDEPVARGHGALAGVQHEEVARAVGALGLAGREAALPEERRLLVAEQRGERDAADLAERRRWRADLARAAAAARRSRRAGRRPSRACAGP